MSDTGKVLFRPLFSESVFVSTLRLIGHWPQAIYIRYESQISIGNVCEAERVEYVGEEHRLEYQVDLDPSLASTTYLVHLLCVWTWAGC